MWAPKNSPIWKSHIFLRMDRDILLNVVRQYCANNGYTKTAKKLSVPKIKIEKCDDIEIVFQKYLKTGSQPKTGLGFKIKLLGGQMERRKRLRAVNITEENFKSKKAKKKNVKVKNAKITALRKFQSSSYFY